MSVGRKVFQCVVDDTALTSSVGELKKWTSQGAITLVVPLYTLGRLRSLKKAPSQTGLNARESVRFLDRVTSGKHSIPCSKVTLQGPMEQFDAWEEAQRFLLPEFKEEAECAPKPAVPAETKVKEPKEKPAEQETVTEEDPQNPLNEMSQMLLSKLNFKKDADATSLNSGGSPSVPASSMSPSSSASPECAIRRLGDIESSQETEDIEAAEDEPVFVAPATPDELKPLLNSVLWRLHGQPEAATSSSCVLVTNNRTTQIWAQKFGITVKSIPQLRTSIIYEEKEYKNHCKYLEKNQNQISEPKPLLSHEDESDDDVLVFVPRGQAKSTTPAVAPRTPHKGSPSSNKISNGHVNGNVGTKDLTPPEPAVEVPSTPIDPDSFNRNYGPKKQGRVVDLNSTNMANRAPTGPTRGGGGRRGAPRGGMVRGNGRGRGKLWVP